MIQIWFCNCESCACSCRSFQGVLTLFCSGSAQVCHVLRVEELREQLEVEEEDGDRQEEEEEVESGEAGQGECAMRMTVDEVWKTLRT